MQTVAGYTFQEILGTNHRDVEHWKALGNKGVAEIFVVPASWRTRIDALPKNWNSFCDFDVQPYEGKLAVIVPGILKMDLYGLHRQLGNQSSIVFAWHIASAMALLHDTGSAHGMLHPQSIGLDEEGALSIRPAIIDSLKKDPDPKATAQATDCWQMATVLEVLIGADLDDDRLRLLLCGLQRDRASIRLQPARAIRQSLVAITAAHPEWETKLKEVLGAGWGMDTLPPIEHSIIPKLYPQRPRAQLPQTVDTTAYNPWSSPFVSTQKETNIQKTQRISLPSTGVKPETKLRLPIPEKGPIVFDEEIEVQEQDTQTIAQIRLPFVSVVSDADSAMRAEEEESSFEDFFDETLQPAIEVPSISVVASKEIETKEAAATEVEPESNQEVEITEPHIALESSELEEELSVEDRRADSKEDILAAVETEEQSKAEAVVEKIVVSQPEAMFDPILEEPLEAESREENSVFDVPDLNLEESVPSDSIEAHIEAEQEDPDAVEESFPPDPIEAHMEEGQDAQAVEPEAEEITESMPSVGLDPDAAKKERDAVIRTESEMLEEPDLEDEGGIVEDPEPKRRVFLMAPEEASEEEFLDFIDEEALFSEDDAYDNSQESQEHITLAIETTVVKREIEEVEEIPYETADPEPAVGIALPDSNVAEFFEDSEEQAEDSEDSEPDRASVSIYEDSGIEAEDSRGQSQITEDFDPLGSEEDFLASIFNDREILALEKDAKNRLASVPKPHFQKEYPSVEPVENRIENIYEPSEEVSMYTEESSAYTEESTIYSHNEEHVAGFESFRDDGFSNSNHLASKTVLDDVFDEDIGDVQPRWMSAKKITADPLREDELGAGKWGEAKSNLDQSVLKEVMSSMPTRELELDDDGNNWALMLFGLIGGAVVVLFLYNIITNL